MQLVFFFTGMQLFHVIFHQNSKLDSLRLGLTFQIENPLSCRRVWKAVLWNTFCKNKISQDLCSPVTVNKHAIIDQNSYCRFGKIFILAMVNWIQYCTNFNLLNLICSFVLPPFHCSPSFNFQALFLFFYCNHCKQFSFIQCSALVVLLFLTFFFYSWHCVYSL